ncbi:MAG: hypothetical protein AAF065_12560 [Verrucomicrobiota bacterium]
MKVYLTDYCYDADKNLIRTKGRKEFTRPTVILASLLFALFFILAPFFELSRIYSLFGLLPLVGLLRPLRSKVLFSKDEQVVSFFETTKTVNLDPQKKVHCHVIEDCGDSYYTSIYYDTGDNRITLLDSSDFISEINFDALFGSIFENLSYEFTIK